MAKIAGARIVLTGGAGFIGHNLALRLKKLGADVTVIDSLAVNNYYAFKEKQEHSAENELYLRIIRERLDLLQQHDIPLLEIDAREYHELSHAVSEANPDMVVHLAAVAHANKSNKDPYSTFDHSLRTLENALDIARSSHLSVQHFVYFSSSMVYGHFTDGSVTEESLCDPIGIYGALKFAGEKLVIAYGQVFNLPYTIIRPSALYGPRCVSRRVGQVFVENVMSGKEVQVHGDGSDRLDFTYIFDLVSGVVNVLEHENSRGEIFNLTYGESRSIAQMADIISEHFPDVQIKYLPKDKLMPDRGTLSVEKARDAIGYAPQYPLERGFPEYIKWYQSIWQLQD